MIEIKLFMSHYSHKSISDAKCKADSSSSFPDITSKNSLGKREQVIKFGYLPRKTDLTLKMSFYVQNQFFRPKIDPHVNFSNFQAEENFSFSKFFGTSR